MVCLLSFIHFFSNLLSWLSKANISINYSNINIKLYSLKPYISVHKIIRKKWPSFLKILTLKELSWIRGVEEILKIIIIDTVVLSILGLHMKDIVGKEQWQTNWCPGWEPETRDQGVGPEENMECLTLDKSLNLAVLYPYFEKENEEVKLPNL